MQGNAMVNAEPTRDILVLCGGISTEREVSLAGGAAVAEALARRGHRVTSSDISPADISALDHRPYDVVFPLLHGIFGEDGQVQRLIESRHLAYVGSTPAASEIAMDKARTKQRLLDSGISTPSWRIAWRSAPDVWAELSSEIGYPQVIKPVDGGSSVDCHVCQDTPSALKALELSLTRNDRMLIEKCIRGPEITIGILDEQPLPTIEVRPKAVFYDYSAKYKREDTQYIFDINLPARSLDAARQAALDCHRIIGARHLSRIDIMIDASSFEPFVLEINTMPGFTSHSLVPKAAARCGIPFDVLCDRLCAMAVRDHAANDRLVKV